MDPELLAAYKSLRNQCLCVYVFVHVRIYLSFTIRP